VSMTVVIARNAPDRYRGFLASVMLEVAPCTYVSPSMTKGVRERLLAVCNEWSSLLPADGSVTLLWRDKEAPGGLRIESVGVPKAEIVDHDGIWLDRHKLTLAQEDQLDTAPCGGGEDR